MNTPQLPPLPNHPEPRIMEWTKLEMRTIKEYGEACALAAIQAPAIVVQQEQTELRKAVFSVLEDFMLPHDVRKILESAYYTHPTQQALTTCNCRWDGEAQVQQCTLHEAHVDAIHEWAERAKTAEAKLSTKQAKPQPLSDEQIDDIQFKHQDLINGFQWLAFAREIEVAHGIKE